MKTLVVYESMWGNTEVVARAVAEGLAELAEVRVLDVMQAPRDPDADVALIVAGGPTHAFSMTRPKTRSEAVQKGAPQGSLDVGLREWLSNLSTGTHAPVVATFDTKVDKARHLPGSARSAAKVARKHGYHTEKPESFYVRDIDGPLVAGEAERAREWGRQLAAVYARSSA